jgi:stress-induced morphogen
MSETEQLILERLRAVFPDARMALTDTTGTDDHWELKIASEAFAGLNRVKQHQAVYKPLRDLIDANRVHALKLHTCTPDQWQGD